MPLTLPGEGHSDITVINGNTDHTGDMMPIYRQNDDGSWGPARPVPATRILRVERWMRRRGWHRLAAALARWDERGLGR